MNTKILPILLSVLLSATFTVKSKTVEIKGFVANSTGFKYAVLSEFFGSDLIRKDSAAITNNSFSFKSEKGFPKGFYQIKFNENTFFNLILSVENIEIKADLKNLAGSLVISGSKENDVYKQYKTFSDAHNAKIVGMQDEVNKAMALQNSDPQAFQNQMEKLKGKYDSLTQIQQVFLKKLADQNKNLFAGKFISVFVADDLKTKDNFISKDDFNDPELLRGDMLYSKVNLFYQQFVERSLEAWQTEAQTLIAKTEGTKGQEIVYNALISIFASVDMDYTSALASRYAKAYPASAKAKSILASLPKASPQVGDVAPDISLPDPDGKNVTLSSLKGKVVLLDFWASWCGPCRMENPNVVGVYNKFKDKGFAIYSVSLDSDKAKWLQAIEKDNLTWTHVSDLKNWKSEGAQLYSVQSIPATYLIGKDGKIVAKNLRGQKLEEELKKILDNKLTN